MKRICLLLTGTVLAFGMSSGALAAQMESGSTYCFGQQEFGPEGLEGICITSLPSGSTGTLMLGSRILQPGDILPASRLDDITFLPVPTGTDRQTSLKYLPVFADRVEKSTVMTFSIKGKEDKAPVAQDGTLETYKNLPNEGKLQVSDPEGEKLTYTLCRKPRRGTVELSTDGTYTYTPKHNKVGVDSFTYTAADPAGHVSREATVTVQIMKPTDSARYTDTMGNSCRFEAEWLRNNGLFQGEQVGGENCFFPDKTVSRGQFLTMVVKLLDIPAEDTSAIPAETPQWLRPYVGAALRAGLLDGIQETGAFYEPVTGGEAAVILQNALDLHVDEKALETMENMQEPQWAGTSLLVMAQHGISLRGDVPMTRAEVAETLYQTYYLSLEAPGMAVFRMQHR